MSDLEGWSREIEKPPQAEKGQLQEVRPGGSFHGEEESKGDVEGSNFAA